MRIWDVEPGGLCREHLLGEHRELHAIWSILTGGRRGYSKHPETLRWKGSLKALFIRHEKLVVEMIERGYRHMSPLDQRLAKGSSVQDIFLDSVDSQKSILRGKGCSCRFD